MAIRKINTLKKDELRKKINNGTITCQELDDNVPSVFSIIKENMFTPVMIQGVLLFKNHRGGLRKRNPENEKKIKEFMEKFNSDDLSPEEMYTGLADIGMTLEMCTLILSLLHENTVLKKVANKMEDMHLHNMINEDDTLQ